jgi:quercetin dioxygenase-like cupin family protein
MKIFIKTAVAGLLLGQPFLGQPLWADDTYPPVDVLVSSTTSIIGEPLSYPEGSAKITGAVITMQLGDTTGWHKHNVPLFAYMLEGEITVDYGDHGTRTYQTGDSFIEAFQSPHNGRVTGDGIARVLAVFAGAEGVANSEVTD